MKRNDKLAARLKEMTIWIYVVGAIFGALYLGGFFPLAFLLWGLTFIFGSLTKAASVIITRLDDIWFSMNPVREAKVEVNPVETAQTE